MFRRLGMVREECGVDRIVDDSIFLRWDAQADVRHHLLRKCVRHKDKIQIGRHRCEEPPPEGDAGSACLLGCLPLLLGFIVEIAPVPGLDLGAVDPHIDFGRVDMVAKDAPESLIQKMHQHAALGPVFKQS